MKVLIVQDFVPIGRRESTMLSDLGHQVTWVIGFNDVARLEGYLPNKSIARVGCDYDVAIVDGQIYGPSGKVEAIGDQVVHQLVQSGVGCVIANSSKEGYNFEMVKAGAHRAINQVVLFVAMVIAKLTTPSDMVAPSDAAAVLFCMDLVSFTDGPGKPFQAAAEAALMDD
ncbi:MAG: hypothetical protein SGJ27_10350 [Candidatus Melainabacteria bacterium]|nr:hypothetical protein [Candidatus Melainabacteria bacterium]